MVRVASLSLPSGRLAGTSRQQSPCRNGSPFPVEKGLEAFPAFSLLRLAACLLGGGSLPPLRAVRWGHRLWPQPHGTAQVSAPPRAGESSPGSPLLVEELLRITARRWASRGHDLPAEAVLEGCGAGSCCQRGSGEAGREEITKG